MEHFRPFAAVYLILIKDNQVLLARRYSTGFMDGFYGLPSGHLDEGESLTTAMIRESREEINITPLNLQLAGVMHRFGAKPADRNYIDTYFMAQEWDGEITKMESDKCDVLQWFELDNLPENIIPYIATVLKSFRDGIQLIQIEY